MYTMGFLISQKNGEKRRALLPKDIIKIKNKNKLYFEEGYGESIGVSDYEYIESGANISSRENIFKCDIIVDVKLGDANYLEDIDSGKILFGWAHAVQNIQFTNKIIQGSHTVIAWEEIFENGRNIFYRNSEIAGEAAILQAYQYYGKMPYETKVAILGNGQTAKGALRILNGLGATVDIYGRKLENLFKEKMYEYDVIVNCIMWDTNRTDRIIYKEDLKKFKKGAMIIDVSCDPYLEIETSHPTTIDNPIYIIDNVIHYAVDNTAAMFPYTTTNVLSENLYKFIDEIIEGNIRKEIQDAIVIKKGEIIHKNIKEFRKIKGITL